MLRRGLLVAGLAAVASFASALTYTFDTDNQGWRQADFNQSTFQLTFIGPSTWTAPGQIEENDFANWAFDVSPNLAGGLQGSPSISFDYSADATDNQAYPFLVLAAPTEAIYVEQIPTADGAYHHYSYSLTDPTGWKHADIGGFRAATQADIDNVLTSLVLIGVDADTLSGADHTRLDNVQLGAVPEPMTMLGLAAMAALVRARKRRA
ncbi:MAG: PEP-CTERM sorting domain-containing protein [Armatimonadetes bacterium]|nr:PEP-CTERM sorting domain-containing protein [Armatimonadota bacterium]